MATILQTTTEFSETLGVFALLTSYSGEINPNITFTVTFTVIDGFNPIINIEIDINGDLYYTDANGQVSIDLIRGNYTANLSKSGFEDNSINFIILDQNVVENVVMTSIGSFDESFDESYE